MNFHNKFFEFLKNKKIEEFQFTKNKILIANTIKTGVQIEIPIHPQVKRIITKRNRELPEVISDQKYALKIGFHNNPYAVYIHEENSEKEHIHILVSRIKEDSKAVSDSFTHYKNMDFLVKLKQNTISEK